MRVLLRLFPATLLILGFLNRVAAQDSNPESVSIRFEAIGWTPPSQVDELFYASGKEPHALDPMHASLRSKTYAYSGPPVLRFFRMIQNEEGEKVPEIVGELRIPAGSKRLLLVFFPKEAGKFEILPMEDDSTTFPVGSYKFVNFTRSRFALQVDGELKQIGYREQVLFRIPPGDAKAVELQIAKQNSETWEMFHRTVLPHSPNRRVIFFLVERESKGRTYVNMRQLVDYASELPPPPPAEDTP